MTNKEAIERLNLIKVFDAPSLQEAIGMAVEAIENHAVMKTRIDTLIKDLEKCVEAEKKDHKQYFTAELMILRLKDIEVQND